MSGYETESNAAGLVGISITFLTLSWIAVLVRVYVRLFLTKTFQADDWLMLIAQSLYTVANAFAFEGTRVGIGRHNSALDDYSKMKALMWQTLIIPTYILIMMFIKQSIGVFLFRLSVERIYNRIICGSLVVISTISISLFFWNLFKCRPVGAQWNPDIPGAKCVSSGELVAAAYVMSGMSIVSDWLYAILPMFMVWKVKMSKQAKVTVIFILGLGVLASIATCIRIRYLSKLLEQEDILYVGTNALIWSLIEPGIAIVAASLATIRPLLRAINIRGFESSARRSSAQDYFSSRNLHNSKHSVLHQSKPRPQRDATVGDITMIDLECGTGSEDDLRLNNPSPHADFRLHQDSVGSGSFQPEGKVHGSVDYGNPLGSQTTLAATVHDPATSSRSPRSPSIDEYDMAWQPVTHSADAKH